MAAGHLILTENCSRNRRGRRVIKFRLSKFPEPIHFCNFIVTCAISCVKVYLICTHFTEIEAFERVRLHARWCVDNDAFVVSQNSISSKAAFRQEKDLFYSILYYVSTQTKSATRENEE